jgi:hypothetical protein
MCMTVGHWLLEFFWDNNELLEGMNKWGGVLMALTGAILVAPQGSMHLWDKWIARPAEAARVKLLQLLGKSQAATVHVGPGVGTMGGVGTPGAAQYEHWSDSFTDEQKFAWLYDRIERVERDWRSKTDNLDAVDTEIRRDLKELEQRAFGEVAKLEKAIELIESQTVQIDSTGLWPIVAGIFLTGVPEELSEWWVWGWVVWVAAAGVTIIAVRRSKKSGVWKRPN